MQLVKELYPGSIREGRGLKMAPASQAVVEKGQASPLAADYRVAEGYAFEIADQPFVRFEQSRGMTK
jgi:hypothetical protein